MPYVRTLKRERPSSFMPRRHARMEGARPLGRCWIAPGEGSLAMGLLLDAIPTLGGSPSGAPCIRRNTTTVMMVQLGAIFRWWRPRFASVSGTLLSESSELSKGNAGGGRSGMCDGARASRPAVVQARETHDYVERGIHNNVFA
jgi:hypothetical protein